MKKRMKSQIEGKKLDYPVALCYCGQSSCWNYTKQKRGISSFKEMRTEIERIAFCHGCLSERWRIINLGKEVV